MMVMEAMLIVFSHLLLIHLSAHLFLALYMSQQWQHRIQESASNYEWPIFERSVCHHVLISEQELNLILENTSTHLRSEAFDLDAVLNESSSRNTSLPRAGARPVSAHAASSTPAGHRTAPSDPTSPLDTIHVGTGSASFHNIESESIDGISLRRAQFQHSRNTHRSFQRNVDLHSNALNLISIP